MKTSIKSTAILAVTTMLFAGLALDISVPAVVLSVMAIARNVVVHDFSQVFPAGEVA